MALGVYAPGSAHRACSQHFIPEVLGGGNGGEKRGQRELEKVTGVSLEDEANGRAGGVGGQTEPHLPEFQIFGILKNLPVCRAGVEKTENRINSLKSFLPALRWEQ